MATFACLPNLLPSIPANFQCYFLVNDTDMEAYFGIRTIARLVRTYSTMVLRERAIEHLKINTEHLHVTLSYPLGYVKCSIVRQGNGFNFHICHFFHMYSYGSMFNIMPGFTL